MRAVPAATPPTITEGGRLVNGIGAVSAAMPLVSHARRAPAFAEKSADFWTPVLATMGTMPRKRPAIPSARTTCRATLPMDCEAKRDSAAAEVRQKPSWHKGRSVQNLNRFIKEAGAMAEERRSSAVGAPVQSERRSIGAKDGGAIVEMGPHSRI